MTRPPSRTPRTPSLSRVVTPLIRTGMRALSVAAPPLAGRAAFEMFVRPRRVGSHPGTRAIMARGRRFSIPLGSRTVAAWSWGTGPGILMTHGWSGRASQLAAFVDPLLRHGLRVIAYDAPAHGASTGRHTNVREAADAARAVADTVGGIHGAIAHSLGATAVILALQNGLEVKRAALIAPPDDLGHFFHGFAGRLGLNPAALHEMERRIERVTGVPWREFRAESIARDQQASLLIVHDENDRDVPISHGRAWHRSWPGAELLTTVGLGHRALLRHPDVIDSVVGFVTRGVVVTSATATVTI